MTKNALGPRLNKDLPRGARAINLAKKIAPHLSFREARRGVVRKGQEWSVEQYARIVVAARGVSMSPSKFIRIVVQDYLDKHTMMPQFSPATNIMGVTRNAYEVGHHVANPPPQPAIEDPFAGVVGDVLERLAP